MATTSSALAPRDLPNTKISSGPGLFSRMFAALTAAHMRQAEREVARYLEGHGGKFTDEAEREIERRFLSNQSRW